MPSSRPAQYTIGWVSESAWTATCCSSIAARRASKSTKRGPAGPRFVDLEARLAAMDEQQVAVHALSLTQPMVYWAGRELGMRLAALFNDEAAAAHEKARDRFYGLATLPMHVPDLAKREAERAAT